MFKSKNFCHIASNNRNQVKVGVFTYRTTDNLETVSASGYFNERIIDINLHDIIIHEEIDSTDNTKVKYNFLCVTERTLENVGTIVLKTDWQDDIEQAIEDLQTYVNNNFVKLDGTSVMTGPLKMRATSSFQCAIAPFWDGVGFYKLNSDDSVTLIASIETPDGFVPWVTNTYNIGSSLKKWKNLYLAGTAYITKINNGYDIAVPVTNSADTLALKSEVDLAANSGRMILGQGVWYAKMYAATVAPSAENGTNYADFSQVDGQGNPIIVIYERQNGAWVQDQTITPPADYDGYVSITSKIWDITEQAGQQGGRILWNHQSKEFTPYPQIISFENAALTGVPTAPLADASSPNNQIATKEYVDDLVSNSGTGRNVGDIFLTMRNDNELNGAVECDGSTYNTTDFTGAQSIGNLLADGKVPYVSMAVYASTVAAQGWCDKFGWDGTGNIQFKVPTLSAYVFQKLQLAIKGSIGTSGSAKYFVATQSSFGQSTYPNVGSFNVSVANDQTIPGANVDVTSEDVAQQRCMVQLAISATDEALETCTGVLADVAALKYDYVVDFQAPTAQNNYTWYRKYKSGWVEQGGIKLQNTTNKQDLSLPVEMNGSTYSVLTSVMDDSLSAYVFCVKVTDKTTTGFKTTVWGSYQSGTTTSGYNFVWQVSGVAA